MDSKKTDKRKGEQKVVARIQPAINGEEATIVTVKEVLDEPPLVGHLIDLRKQLLKSVGIFLFFFLMVFSTILLMTTIPVGVLFELPIVTLFLSALGLLTAASMKKVRKWSYLAIVIISALITPPDFISQLIVMIPMLLLYEVSIFLVIFAERRKILTK
ncbi:twin-arginine translocase subunit TatC [Sporosarcina sp. FSL W7-1349]|uniref:twin-arginine translocase subunit TatC n=1 Tax=Sporosarcina sp. FSL W7-1349 TaxID=2921561 RepID=UPI0030FA4BCF